MSDYRVLSAVQPECDHPSLGEYPYGTGYRCPGCGLIYHPEDIE